MGRTLPLQRNTSMLQPIVNSLGQFFDVFGLLESGYGEDVAVILLQGGFEFFGEFGQLAGVVQRLLEVGLQNLVALQFSVRKPCIFGRFFSRTRMWGRLRRNDQRES